MNNWFNRHTHTPPSSNTPTVPSAESTSSCCEVLVVGGGIVGLVLALALHKELNITAEIYEQADAFQDDIGAGMSMYPNGLRVLRDIDEDLLSDIQAQGALYKYSRYERHDGRFVAVSLETALSSAVDLSNQNQQQQQPQEHLNSFGIRRWRLQKALYAAVQQRDIQVHFGKRVRRVEEVPVQVPDSNDATPHDVVTANTLVQVTFQDGTTRLTRILFGADGSKSEIRRQLLALSSTDTEDGAHQGQQQQLHHHDLHQRPSPIPTPQLKYTGVTCLMGIAQLNADGAGEGNNDGVCWYPTSATTKCHGAFFPTGHDEQCFQFHFQVPGDQVEEGSWGVLKPEEARWECEQLADRLRHDGWSEHYLTPLLHVTKAVRVAFGVLEPRLTQWVYGAQSQMVLLGDAAHPPVPYLGQGAQMGLEDVGTLVLLLTHYCSSDEPEGNEGYNSSQQQLQQEEQCKRRLWRYTPTGFAAAMRLFETIRIARTNEILDNALQFGTMQQKRADNPNYNAVREQWMQREIFFHDALPIWLPGTRYNYKDDVTHRLVAQQQEQSQS